MLSYMMFWARVLAHHRHYASPSVNKSRYQHIDKVSQSNIPNLSLTLCLFCDLCRIPWHFQVSRIPEKW